MFMLLTCSQSGAVLALKAVNSAGLNTEDLYLLQMCKAIYVSKISTMATAKPGVQGRKHFCTTDRKSDDYIHRAPYDYIQDASYAMGTYSVLTMYTV
jgi:hypothetical protein